MKQLAERIGFVGTPSYITALTEVIELTRKTHGFTYEKAYDYVEQCFKNALAQDSSELRLKPYFFLVDKTFEMYRPEMHLPIPAPAPVVCKRCEDRGWLHLQPHQPSVNGSRLVPCVDCNPDGKRALA